MCHPHQLSGYTVTMGLSYNYNDNSTTPSIVAILPINISSRRH